MQASIRKIKKQIIKQKLEKISQMSKSKKKQKLLLLFQLDQDQLE